MTIRVLLVEDHPTVREALCEVLSRESDIEIAGEAGDASEGLRQVVALVPDVLVLDISLPDLSGIEVAARLQDAGSQAKVVALSAFTDKRFVTAMLRAGASAYVTKSAAGTELVRAIRAVAEGKGYFCPEIAHAVVSEVRDRPVVVRNNSIAHPPAPVNSSGRIAVAVHGELLTTRHLACERDRSSPIATRSDQGLPVDDAVFPHRSKVSGR